MDTGKGGVFLLVHHQWFLLIYWRHEYVSMTNAMTHLRHIFTDLCSELRIYTNVMVKNSSYVHLQLDTII